MTKKYIPTKTSTGMEVVEKATKMQSHSPLFKHLEDEHGLILVESEIREIEIIIGRMYEEPKTENEFLHHTLVNLLRLGEPAMRHIYDSLGARLVNDEEVMTNDDKKQLENEIRHIFESGENELRIFNMVVNFIEKRYSIKTPISDRLPNDEEITWEQFMLAYAQSATSLTFVHWAMNENYKLIKK